YPSSTLQLTVMSNQHSEMSSKWSRTLPRPRLNSSTFSGNSHAFALSPVPSRHLSRRLNRTGLLNLIRGLIREDMNQKQRETFAIMTVPPGGYRRIEARPSRFTILNLK